MDLQIAIYLNKLGAGTFLDKITTLTSSNLVLASIGTFLILTALIFDKTKGKKVFIAIFIAAILHFLINEYLLKHLLGNIMDLRVRPYVAHPDLITTVGIQKFQDASFPSSHMASTMAMITIFTHYYRKTQSTKTRLKWITKLVWPTGIIFALLMAFSRIHNGMHYPTDVIAGGIFGILYGSIGIYITNKKARNII